jgi:hypothetical protein
MKTPDKKITVAEFNKMKPKAKPKHEESSLQIECVEWFKREYPNHVIFSQPNGGARNAITGAILKREGTMRGVPDLQVLFANNGYNGLFIEMKTKKGTQSEFQKEFEWYCKKFGYKYVICRTKIDFIKEIRMYLFQPF